MSDHSQAIAHQEHSNPWPFTAAAGLTIAVIGALPLMYNLPPGLILTEIGMFLFVLGMVSWLVQIHHEQAEVVAGTRTDVMDHRTPLWTTGFVILSELFLFGALFASYFYLHFIDWEKTQSVMNFFVVNGEVVKVMGPVVVMNTILLISSSVTFQIGEKYLKKDVPGPFRLLVAVTIVLGVVFLGGQIFEYFRFITVDKFTPTTGPFGTLFFSLTSLHGLHVTAGLLLMIYVLVGSMSGQFSAKHHKAVTVIGIYWHFVDVVWIFLVAVLYLRVI